jgi:hypothetical protein
MNKITEIFDKFSKIRSRHLFNKVTEYGRGRIEGRMLSNRSVEEAKTVIMRETIACNFDFLKGLNETLNKELAKKAYKSIGEVK